MRYKSSLVYPFLFGIFPIASLYATNAAQLIPSVTYRPLALMIGMTAILILGFSLIYRSVDKGALMTTAFIVISFILALWWKLLPKDRLSADFFTYLGYALFVGGGVIIGIVFQQIRKMRDLLIPIRVVNVIAGVLLVGPVIQIGNNLNHQAEAAPRASPASQATTFHGQRPNIYYIILDGYGREDVLQDYFHYDNSKFVRFLQDRGFYVCSQSRSNYAHTLLSLSSSMNLDYIPQLEHVPDQQAAATHLLRYNKASRFLKNNGYTVIHLNSGWTVTAENSLADLSFSSTSMDEFDSSLLFNIVPKFLVDALVTHHQRRTILFNLAKLSQIPKLPGIKFTFAHFICPHPPFVFGRAGQVPPNRDVWFRVRESHWQPKSQYLDQLGFITDEIEKVIDGILRDSTTPPIIIVQSDHGPASDGIQMNPSYVQVRERTSILNAYFVPEATRRQLYQSITPVNSLRIIFDSVLGSHFGRLADRVFYSGEGTPPFSFNEVTAMKRLPQVAVHNKPPQPFHPQKATLVPSQGITTP